MAFKYELADGSKWSPEAGGYVKDGKLVSNIPQFTEGATTKQVSGGTLTTHTATGTQTYSPSSGSGAKVKVGGVDYINDPFAGTPLASSGSRTGSSKSGSNLNYYSQQDFARAIQEALREYSFPYEQALRDLIAQAPSYEMPSEAELARQAREWAELQINPQLEELTRALEQAQQALSTRQQQVEASYAGMEEAVNRMMAEAAQRALESAIARGGGQSGAVEWLTRQLQTPITEQFTAAQAQKAAELADIASRLAMLQEQAGTQRTQLQERLGQLEANRLAELRNLAYAQATGNWQQVMQSVSNLAQMATQAQQYSQQLAASLLPYYTLTEQQRQYQPMSWAELMGEVPEAPTVPSSGGGVVPLRSFVSQQGGSIDYDPATGQVIINGRRYGRDVLESLGGSLQNGSWYLPQSAVMALLGVV